MWPVFGILNRSSSALYLTLLSRFVAAAKFVIFSVFANKKPMLVNFAISPIFHKFLQLHANLDICRCSHIFSLCLGQTIIKVTGFVIRSSIFLISPAACFLTLSSYMKNKQMDR